MAIILKQCVMYFHYSVSTIVTSMIPFVHKLFRKKLQYKYSSYNTYCTQVVIKNQCDTKDSFSIIKNIFLLLE